MRLLYVFWILLFVAVGALAAPQDTLVNTTINIIYGNDPSGAVKEIWQEAVRYNRRVQDGEIGRFVNKPFTEREQAWIKLVESRREDWQDMLDSLRIPFHDVAARRTIHLLIGNQNGNDAFVFADSIICIDVSRMNELYGAAGSVENQDRIDRFFAHEFTHVVHKAWRKGNPIPTNSPLEQALWTCLAEGLGNYRSLSRRWSNGHGKLSDHARTVLKELEPVFAQRISALATASKEEARVLMKGLSSGPFDQKWGALTVALWLYQEANGTDSNLRKWVDAGPYGVLVLAQKYLAEPLAEQVSMPHFGLSTLPPDTTKLWLQHGRADSDTVLISVSGGPKRLLDFYKYGRTTLRYLPGYKRYNIAYLHQSQTYNSTLLHYPGDFTLDDADNVTAGSAEMLNRAILYFKNRGKYVATIGHSYGAFIVQYYLANYQALADRYILTAGKLSVHADMLADHLDGVSGEFAEDGVTYLAFEDDGVGYSERDRREYRIKSLLKAAIGNRDYTAALAGKDLSNVIYFYATNDQNVGALMREECEFLVDSGATLRKTSDGHGATFYRFIDAVMEGDIKL